MNGGHIPKEGSAKDVRHLHNFGPTGLCVDITVKFEQLLSNLWPVWTLEVIPNKRGISNEGVCEWLQFDKISMNQIWIEQLTSGQVESEVVQQHSQEYFPHEINLQ